MSGQSYTSNFVSKLQRLRRLVNGTGGLLSRIDDEIRKLNANHFHLVVLGQFKRGKTTFINALLGEELLPVGIVPVTSVVALIRYGSEKKAEVVFSDNRRMPIDCDSLREYVTEQGNPENRKRVGYVEITYPSSFLEDGIVLVDTPGVGSLYIHNTETTRNFIPNVDAAIVVLSADLPITESEYRFLDELDEHIDRLFFVLNKSDLLTPDEMTDALSYARKVLNNKMEDEHISITPLSARNALQGQTTGDMTMVKQSNLSNFKKTIEGFVGEEKRAVLHARSQDRINWLTAEALFTAELELKAVTTPLTDLQAKIDQFISQTELLKSERESFSYLLQGQIAALSHWIEIRIEQFASSEITKRKDELTGWAKDQSALPVREFRKEMQSALASVLVKDFDAWRKELENLIVTKYDAIISIYTAKTNEFIRRVLQLSADLFQLEVQPFEDVHPMDWKRSFYYRMSNDPFFLEIDTLKVIAVLLPDGLVRKRILRRAQSDMVDKVTRHCGRLRYEYSIQESYRAFQFDLNEKIDGVINEIHSTLNAAMEMRRKQETTIASHVGGLQRRTDELRSLQADAQLLQ